MQTERVHLASNLKLLRGWLKDSQEGVAVVLDVKRSSLSGYENGTAEPSLAVLCRMASYFHETLDELVRHDLTAWSHEGIRDWRRRRNHARMHQHTKPVEA